MSAVEELKIEVANRLEEVPRVIDLLHQLCDRHAVPPDTAADVSLALDEVLSNVIRHGKADEFIEVRIALSKPSIDIEVEDDGTPFNPITAPMPRFDIPAVDRGPGGLGIFLTKHMMTELSYRRLNNRNILRMRRSLNSPGSAGARS